MADILAPFAIFAVLIILGFSVGTWRESSHLKSLDIRERNTQNIIVTNLRHVPETPAIREATFVAGNAVIATDYFKTFAAGLRNIVGGEVKTFERLLQRARREARMRMIEEAMALGATEIHNVRYETSNVMGATSRNPAASVEVYAYGTAIIRT
jgi:uncharacterized protein YbjQ (UPF0145 family)